MLALAAAGCSSSSAPKHAAPLPVGGPPDVVRVALADLLWPLEPERAQTRDEIVVARMLFSTPLRTDVSAARCGRPLHELARDRRRAWRLRCTPRRRDRGAASARAALAGRRRARSRTSATLEARRRPIRIVPYRLTEAAGGAARRARAVPADLGEPDAGRRGARTGVRVEFRKLEPFRGAALFRAGRLDEAPVPLGDIRATKLDPQLAPALRVRRLLAADAVVFSPASRARCATSTTTPPTAPTTRRSCRSSRRRRPRASPTAAQPSASKAAIALRDAKKRIPALPQRAVRFAAAARPDAAPTARNLLVAAWRDLGLGAVAVGGTDAELRAARRAVPAPRALTQLGQGEHVVPIAWVADARLVSPRLRGWREDELGSVDYGRGQTPGSSRRR